MTRTLTFNRSVLVYVPAYNCADTIVSVLEEIPDAIWQIAEVLVVDNRSTDDTAERVLRASVEGRFSGPVHLIQPARNRGYAGSQKLAYRLALGSTAVQRVMMLHGDGQYPPELLVSFLPHVDGGYGVVYGYRDKKKYPGLEETPGFTYAAIKLLSTLESLVTGYRRREWHTGFLMYSRRFLERVQLDALTSTWHIDGHMLFAAGVLGEKTLGVPIWKRYRDYSAFSGWARVRYLFHVFRLLFQFRLQKSRVVRSARPAGSLDYSVLSSGESLGSPADGSADA